MALIFRTSNTANGGVNYIKNSPLTYTEGDGNLAWLATNMSGSAISIRSGGNVDITPGSGGNMNLIGDNQIFQSIAATPNAAQYQAWLTSGLSRRAYFGFGSTNNTFTLINETNGLIQIVPQTLGVYMTAGATGWSGVSDERLKIDLIPITNATNKVNSLRAVTGRFKTDEVGKSRSFLIAQDVQSVLPEAVDVGNDELNTLGVRYTEVIPLLVAAIKELKAEIDILKAK